MWDCLQFIWQDVILGPPVWFSVICWIGTGILGLAAALLFFMMVNDPPAGDEEVVIAIIGVAILVAVASIWLRPIALILVVLIASFISYAIIDEKYKKWATQRKQQALIARLEAQKNDPQHKAGVAAIQDKYPWIKDYKNGS